MLSVLNSQAFQKKQHVLTKNSLMTHITFLKVTKTRSNASNHKDYALGPNWPV